MKFSWMSSILALFQNMLPIDTVHDIRLPAYLGTWQQVATSRSTGLLGTGVRYTNVSATYTSREDGTIGVYNRGYNREGNETSISGYSYITGDDETKRKVHFNGVPRDGDYWIVKLGPMVFDEYQYAVVSGPITSYVGTRFALYVLARNRHAYHQVYETEVRQWCKDNGFNMYWNEYVATD